MLGTDELLDSIKVKAERVDFELHDSSTPFKMNRPQETTTVSKESPLEESEETLKPFVKPNTQSPDQKFYESDQYNSEPMIVDQS